MIGSSRGGARLPARFLVVVTSVLSAAAASPATPSADDPLFVDRAADWGLDFVHFNGMTGEYYFPEMTGQGCALLDYDGDGDLDAYLVQGALLAGDSMAEALFPYAGEGEPKDRLYRNDPVRLADGSWQPRFVDVTEASGLAATGYGMGVATGDYDGDGDLDLYLANYGSNQLWRNDGDGTFSDVTREAGVDDPAWSIAATFFDYDRDGRLDIYVVNYLDFDVAKNPPCFDESSRRDYCGPSGFPPVADRLFRNRGPAPDGSPEGVAFEDVSVSSGIARARGRGLGVVAADFDADGWTDVFVANDGQVNFLWENQGAGGEGAGGVTFRDQALLAGVALNREGRAEASMGVDAGDFDADGDLDLFITHLAGESDTLYVNDGSGLFEDRSRESGVAAPSFPYTSFGTGWIDYDNDGWLDLFVASGAVRVIEEQVRAGDLFPLAQPNRLFRNVPREAGGRSFEDVADRAGEIFAVAEVSRGAAFGDVDDDGDTDVLLANNNGPVRLLVNRAGSTGEDPMPWVGFELVEASGGPAIGARVEVVRPGSPPLVRRVRTDGSYASAHDPQVLVGLGTEERVSEVRILWPDGRQERHRGIGAGRSFTLYQGPPSEEPEEAGDRDVEEEDRP